MTSEELEVIVDCKPFKQTQASQDQTGAGTATHCCIIGFKWSKRNLKEDGGNVDAVDREDV